MELDIRGEMEAAAAELETAEQGASPAPEETTSGDSAAEETKAPEQDAAPATEESEPPVADAKPEPQAQQPDTDELPLGGSIPVPRVRKILENARAKARAEVEQQLAWARELDRSKTEEAVKVFQFAEQNPVEFYRLVTERLRSDPRYAAEIERFFSPAQPAAEPEKPKDEKPQPDVLLEDGRLVYSAEQMEKLLGWQERRYETKLTDKVKPFEQAQRQQEQQIALERESQRVMKEVLTWPGMTDKENQKAVAEAMLAQKLNVDQAYRAVVLPRLTDTASIEKRVREQVLAELKQKTRATTQNPGTTLAAPQDFKGKSVREILEATAAELGME